MSVGAEAASLEQNKAVVRNFMEQVYVNRDLDAIDKFIADDFVDHAPVGAPAGPAGVRATTEKFLNAFPDLRTEIDNVTGEGDRVVGRYNISGTHLGELEGIPPTRKQFKTYGLDIVRVRDGKITERWAFRDEMAILRQLGLMM